MTATTLATASQVQKWDSMYFAEYVRDSGFLPYMSASTNSIINVKKELTSGGKTINIPLITRLTGAGVTGSSTLEGNEESLGNYNHSISIEWLRNAVRLPKDQEHYTEMDLRRATRDMLKSWSMDRMRSHIITALGSISGTAYASASTAAKNAWNVANQDRILFGDAVGNYNATHATALGAVTASMKLSPAIVSLAKRIAKTADPHIRPMRVEGGREYFVMFTDSLAFRDLKENSAMAQANREARERSVGTNPIFQDGDLIYDGVIIREIPEIASVGTVGASSAAVSPFYLCGAQALGIAWGQEPKSTADTFDYKFFQGIGIEEARGVAKLVFNGVDHGIVTGFVAAAADA